MRHIRIINFFAFWCPMLWHCFHKLFAVQKFFADNDFLKYVLNFIYIFNFTQKLATYFFRMYTCVCMHMYVILWKFRLNRQFFWFVFCFSFAWIHVFCFHFSYTLLPFSFEYYFKFGFCQLRKYLQYLNIHMFNYIQKRKNFA